MMHGAQAQGGIRVIPWSYEPLVEGGSIEAHFGLGYDQDLNERLSLLLTARLTVDAGWVVNYRSAFHFSDNGSSSFYMGPTIGVRSVGDTDRATIFPAGLRFGLRGGLERFYADLYAGVHVNLGANRTVMLAYDNWPQDLRTTSFCFGLDLGWGWAGR